MLAKVNDSYRWPVFRAFAGLDFIKGEWRPVPADRLPADPVTAYPVLDWKAAPAAPDPAEAAPESEPEPEPAAGRFARVRADHNRPAVRAFAGLSISKKAWTFVPEDRLPAYPGTTNPELEWRDGAAVPEEPAEVVGDLATPGHAGQPEPEPEPEPKVADEPGDIEDLPLDDLRVAATAAGIKNAERKYKRTLIRELGAL